MWAREPNDVNGQRRGMMDSTLWTEGFMSVVELAARLPNTPAGVVGGS